MTLAFVLRHPTCFWYVWGRFGMILGCSWDAFGILWAAFGMLWDSLGMLLGFRMFLGLFWNVFSALAFGML